MSTKPNFKFVPEGELALIYEASREFSQKNFSGLFRELKVHSIHKDAVGYWPSTALMVQKVSTGFELPKVENALVIPFYHSNFSLAHIRLIIPQSTGYKLMSLGPTPNGWFNLLNASRNYSLSAQHDANYRLKLHDSLLHALQTDVGVHSDIITESNLKNLLSITRMISIQGSTKFIRKFENKEGFDIEIGKSGMSISDFSCKNFVLQDLVGLDMRAVVPQAVNYAAQLPFYERQKLNAEFMSVFKLDLRNAAPYLFEPAIAERKILKVLAEVIKEDFILIAHKFDIDKASYVISVGHRDSKTEHPLLLNEKCLSEFFSFFYGDLVDFCFSKRVGGLPASYTWDEVNRVRRPRTETFDRTAKLFYMVVLNLLKGEYVKK
jgi:hypothetical protein